jgi:phenylpyruvate tautomerase PptA (4-oxalocrotonate tautomerase family)
MKKSILVVSLSLACALATNAQKAETRATGDASNQASAGVDGAAKSISLDSGTRLSGELQNTVDVRNVKVGDQVVLKTTQAIKSGGRTIVGKGAKLIGRVTEVAQKTKGDNQSRVGILFDRLEHGSLALPISATISSITTGRANGQRNDEDVFGTSASASARSSSSARASSGSSGGLLGGTGGVLGSTASTVGDVVGGTTSAVGSTVNSTTNVVGSTAAGAGKTLGRIQISGSTSTSVEGSSVLSLQGGNLRLDKGTNFNLVLTQSATVGTSKDQ